MKPIEQLCKNPEPIINNDINYKEIGLNPSSRQFKRFHKAGLLNNPEFRACG